FRSFVTIADVPVGYSTPKFPSLYWPVNNKMYTVSYLYYTYDIWKFTIFWSLIFFIGFYGAAGLWAALVHRKLAGGCWILGFYVLIGGVQGIISGTVVGLVLSAIYRAGLFSMSTWIPLCSGVFQILFNVVTSYSMMSVIF
ncbi:hypothetical protein WICANDRAFT_37073, partial [Wickerhamomyces anomalus NRRL Y-366-8]